MVVLGNTAIGDVLVNEHGYMSIKLYIKKKKNKKSARFGGENRAWEWGTSSLSFIEGVYRFLAFQKHLSKRAACETQQWEGIAVSQAVGATWELPTHCRLLTANTKHNAILRAGLTPGPKRSQDIFSKSQQHIPVHSHIHIVKKKKKTNQTVF